MSTALGNNPGKARCVGDEAGVEPLTLDALQQLITALTRAEAYELVPTTIH